MRIDEPTQNRCPNGPAAACKVCPKMCRSPSDVRQRIKVFFIFVPDSATWIQRPAGATGETSSECGWIPSASAPSQNSVLV